MKKYPYNLSHSFICLFGGITFLWKCSIIIPLLHLRHQHSTNLQSYDTYSLWPYCINHTHFVVSVILQNRHHCSDLIQMSNGETGRKRGTWTERNELMTELQKKTTVTHFMRQHYGLLQRAWVFPWTHAQMILSDAYELYNKQSDSAENFT